MRRLFVDTDSDTYRISKNHFRDITITLKLQLIFQFVKKKKKKTSQLWLKLETTRTEVSRLNDCATRACSRFTLILIRFSSESKKFRFRKKILFWSNQWYTDDTDPINDAQMTLTQSMTHRWHLSNRWLTDDTHPINDVHMTLVQLITNRWHWSNQWRTDDTGPINNAQMTLVQSINKFRVWNTIQSHTEHRLFHLMQYSCHIDWTQCV